MDKCTVAQITSKKKQNKPTRPQTSRGLLIVVVCCGCWKFRGTWTNQLRGGSRLLFQERVAAPRPKWVPSTGLLLWGNVPLVSGKETTTQGHSRCLKSTCVVGAAPCFAVCVFGYVLHADKRSSAWSSGGHDAIFGACQSDKQKLVWIEMLNDDRGEGSRQFGQSHNGS